MDIQKISEEIKLFSSSTHGSSDYDKDEYFIMSEDRKDFAPFKYLQKRLPETKDIYSLLRVGFVYDSFELSNNENFTAVPTGPSLSTAAPAKFDLPSLGTYEKGDENE